jgi:hypothetical protein
MRDVVYPRTAASFLSLLVTLPPFYVDGDGDNAVSGVCINGAVVDGGAAGIGARGGLLAS